MEIGVVGAGRMGGNMARRWHRGGMQVAVYDRSAEALEDLRRSGGIRTCASVAALIEALPLPRLVWLMLPTGAPTKQTLNELAGLLDAGDLVTDGANAHYRESQRHAAELQERGIGFVDAGVSGGIWGLENGYGLMLGGAEDAIARVTPFAKILAPAPDQVDPLRASRCRAFCQDGPQRHRVRPDAGVCGGLRPERNLGRVHRLGRPVLQLSVKQTGATTWSW